MGMTLSQKILADKAGLREVCAGQLITAKLDLVLGNDITSPVAIGELEKAGKSGVLTTTKWLSLWTTLFPIKTLNRRNSAKSAATLRTKKT